MQNPKTEIPVVLIIFNRPYFVEKQMERLREVKPTKLFIISDAARESKVGEEELVKKCRYIAESVDWECDVKKIYAERNMGCDKRIVSGLNDVFAKVDKAIILEDDCVPNNSFFSFCQEMLLKYENEPNIMYISGSKWASKYPMKYSYGFSYNTGTWGWATWRRAWNEWHWDISEWNSKKGKWLEGIYSKRFRKNWICDVEKYIQKGIVPWDYVWRFCVGSRLSIFPAVNLIQNIGFGIDATHTTDEVYGYDSSTYEIIEINHPVEVVPDLKYPIAVEKQYKIPFLIRVIRKLKKVLL